MKTACSSSNSWGSTVASRSLAIVVVFTCLSLAGGILKAQPKQTSVKEKEFEDFDPKNFDRSTQIDNPWFPLKPGTDFVYEGFTTEEGKRIPHRVLFTVTDLTKVIEGVRVVVVWERDYSSGKLVESELAFFAQDNDGNVWHFGHYRETYDEKELVGGRVWVSGIEGARAGIMMKTTPQLKSPSYSQGYAPPPYNFTDRAVVQKMGLKICVPLKCYEDVLAIAESSKEEGPNAQQLKYYARGVGNIAVGWRGSGEKTQETLELVKLVQLGPEALAKLRAEALELEKRAYTYSRTPPAEPPPATEGQ